MTAVTDEIIGDDRIIRESGVDARIASIISPVLRATGFRLGAGAGFRVRTD